MSTYPRVWINGVACESSQDWFALDPEHPPRVFGVPSIQGVTAPGVDGSIWTPQGPVLSPLFTVTLLLAGSQQGIDYNHALNEYLIQQWSQVVSTPRVLLHHQTAETGGNGTDLYTEGRISDFQYERDPGQLDWGRLTMVFELPGVYWSPTQPGQVSFTFSQTNPVNGTTYTLDSGFATAPLLDGQIRVTGPVTLPKLTNPVTGDVLQLPTIASGQTLRVDLATLLAYRDVTANVTWTSTTGTKVSKDVRTSSTALYNPGTFRIAPGFSVAAGIPLPGTYQLLFNGSGMTGATKVEVRGRSALR